MVMNKILLISVLFCLSFFAQGVELKGVKLEERTHLGNSNLILNGAGVRSKFVFDLYVTALYLSNKKGSAASVLSDTGEKRIALYLLDDISSENLLYAFNSAIEKNHTERELRAMKDALHEFGIIFHRMGRVNQGDVILLDYQPAIGTQIRVNSTLRGTIPGLEFNIALLKIWLGDNPAQEDLKLKLLGGK